MGHTYRVTAPEKTLSIILLDMAVKEKWAVSRPGPPPDAAPSDGPRAAPRDPPGLSGPGPRGRSRSQSHGREKQTRERRRCDCEHTLVTP